MPFLAAQRIAALRKSEEKTTWSNPVKVRENEAPLLQKHPLWMQRWPQTGQSSFGGPPSTLAVLLLRCPPRTTWRVHRFQDRRLSLD
jgi:hypothetical protein